MSEHERERLSAYLDGELPALERGAVERHVAGCAECASRLAELAAVDEAAAGLEAAAPPGYFDDFAARVRARLEAAPAGVQPGGHRPFRLPVWAWAAAAALLLAIVTPLTLRERPAFDAAAPGRVSRPPGPAGAAPARASAGSAAVYREPRAEAQAPRPAAAPLAPAAMPPPAQPPAAVVQDALDRGRSAGPAASGALAPASAAFEEKAANVQLDARPVAVVGMQEAAVAPEDAPRKADAPLAASVVRRGTLLKAPAPASAGDGGGTAAADATGEEARVFASLAAEQPASVAEWRHVSAAWAAFAAGDPQGPRADEARVRAIEAAHEAYRTGGEEEDLAVLRRAVAAYLARPDARQRERARRLSEPPSR